jgi:hypothetical protein
MQLEQSHMRRFLALVLAALFCAVAVSQVMKPFSTLRLSDKAGMVTHYQKSTRYPVEEVGNKPIDIATASGYSTFSFAVKERERDAVAATSMPDEVELTEWLSKCLFHRRTPARSSDDSN